MPDRPSTVPRLRWYLLVVTFPEAFVFFQGCLLASVETEGGARVPAPARQATTRDLVFLSSHIPSHPPSPVQSRQGLLLILPPHPHPHPHTRPARQGKAQGQPKLTRPAPAPPRALTRIPQSSARHPSLPPPRERAATPRQHILDRFQSTPVPCPSPGPRDFSVSNPFGLRHLLLPSSPPRGENTYSCPFPRGKRISTTRHPARSIRMFHSS